MSYRATLKGIGSALPRTAVSNETLCKTVDSSDAWIRERSGIAQRYIAEADESAASLGVEAARRAIADAGIDNTAIDAVIVATTTPDHVFPSVAVHIQKTLGLPPICAFDVQAVCAGFIYALGVADTFIQSRQYKTVLVVGTETMSRLMNWQDRTTAVLFGDGAGAFVLQGAEGGANGAGILKTRLLADGQYADLLDAKRDATAPLGGYLAMDGKAVFKAAVTMMGNLAEETLKDAGLGLADLDLFIPHQANIRIIYAIAKRLNLTTDKVITTIAEHANTSAASVPLAFDAAYRAGRIQPGQIILCEAFGGGFAWGSVLLRI